MESRESRKPVVVMVTLGTALLVLACGVCVSMLLRGNSALQAAQRTVEQQQLAADGVGRASTLRIESLDLELPISWSYSEELLKNALCRYSGGEPDQRGNLVLTGHDYLSGAHFGTLDRIATGASVTVYDVEGTAFLYTVYEIVTVSPNQVDALNDYEDDHILTLMTCADNANARLLVRCRRGSIPAGASAAA